MISGVAETATSLADGAASGSKVTSAARGRRSYCRAYEPVILAKLEQELSAQRIFQDLRNEHGYQGGYDSVKRFVRRLGQTRPLPMRRMEVAAGQEVQVDFGTGAWIVPAEGKRRKSHVFRVVLSQSRKGYSEATYRQTLDDFLRCLENAFWYFGGVPETVVIDNLRAAVHKPDWFDPELSPKLQSFCQHYGTVVLPTKPRTPRHKGKIENGIGYVKANGLKGHTFDSLEAENRHLLHWEESVADTRIHGTTRQHVRQQFEEVEKPALRPLPRERFPCFQEAQRKVNRDGHVEVARAYYSVPPEYLARTVWARWDARLVRIYNRRFEQIAVHARHEKGRFSTHALHVAPEKISGVERGAAYLLGKVSGIGPHSRQWAEAMLHARGIAGTRVLQGLVSLAGRLSSSALEKACEIALSHQAWRLKTIRQLAGRQADQQQPLPFLDEHPIIRPLDDYARVVATALERGAASPRGFFRHGWAKEDQGQST
jgi:transposase